jgi:hypothetical protein
MQLSVGHLHHNVKTTDQTKPSAKDGEWSHDATYLCDIYFIGPQRMSVLIAHDGTRKQ